MEIRAMEIVELKGFYSMFFIAPEKAGSYRPIVEVLPLHMFNIANVLQTTACGYWWISIDVMVLIFMFPQHITGGSSVFPFWTEYTSLRFFHSNCHFPHRCSHSVCSSPVSPSKQRYEPYLDIWLIVSPSHAQVVRGMSFHDLGITVNYTCANIFLFRLQII